MRVVGKIYIQTLIQLINSVGMAILSYILIFEAGFMVPGLVLSFAISSVLLNTVFFAILIRTDFNKIKVPTICLEK